MKSVRRSFERLALLLLALCSAPTVRAELLHVDPAAPVGGDGSLASPYSDLGTAVAAASARTLADSTLALSLMLAPGRYRLAPTNAVEPTCGNCEDPNTPVPLTYGLRLSGRNLRLVGAEDHQSIVETRAGYGIWIVDCQSCALEGLVVEGGVRDTSGAATDGAIVVQRSSARLEGNWIRDNIGDSTTVASHVVGIIGIACREESRVRIVENRITRNSWDGIALYRDAEAEIVGNVIDGVDLAVGSRVGGGRGVGIGCTWNARATIRGNLVRRYWKGIGLFVDANGTVEDNVVNHVATWGLTLWDAGRGACRGRFRWNAVDSTGACGASIVREAVGPDPGFFSDNAITRSGQNPKYDSGEPYCFQTAIAVHAQPEGFSIERNLVFENRRPEEADPNEPSGDLPEAEFRLRVQTLVQHLARYDATRGSRFFREFGATPKDVAPTRRR
ncbi:MAG: right-handed parallel beta-helix repeat-containing protein [Candidatus Eisenbacteria bacterium]